MKLTPRMERKRLFIVLDSGGHLRGPYYGITFLLFGKSDESL
jgi:hypothetical protein